MARAHVSIDQIPLRPIEHEAIEEIMAMYSDQATDGEVRDVLCHFPYDMIDPQRILEGYHRMQRIRLDDVRYDIPFAQGLHGELMQRL